MAGVYSGRVKEDNSDTILSELLPRTIGVTTVTSWAHSNPTCLIAL